MGEERKQVGLFIDLENIVTSLRKNFGVIPNPMDWIDRIGSYGAMCFARAYGDFSQPTLARIEQGLKVAGIERYNCPVKVHDGSSQSIVDVNMVSDLYEVAFNQPSLDIFILMTGDSDFIRPVTFLRRQLEKSVVIMGVPGAVSRDLVAAAGESLLLEVETFVRNDEVDAQIIRIIAKYLATRNYGGFPTFRFMGEYLRHSDYAAVVPPEHVERLLGELIDRRILVQEFLLRPDGRPIRITRLNKEHPLVQQALETEMHLSYLAGQEDALPGEEDITQTEDRSSIVPCVS